MKNLITIIVGLIVLSLVSCNMDIIEIERKAELEYITVDTSDTSFKKNYLIGESIDYTGIKVICHYSDNTISVADMRLVEFSGFDSSKACEKEYINVSYNGKKSFFEISIEKATISYITVISAPKKTFYYKNDPFEPDGIAVKAVYSNGTTRLLEQSEYDFSGFSSSDYGNYDVTVTYLQNKQFKDDFTIHVVDYEIEEIFINNYPIRKIYTYGEELDLKGLVVNAKIKDNVGNHTETLNSNLYNIEPANFSGLNADSPEVDSNGEVTITVTANNKSTNFKVTLVESYINSFVLKNKIAAHLFYEGDLFKLNDEYSIYNKLSNGNETQDEVIYSTLELLYKGETYSGDSLIKLNGIGIQNITINFIYKDIITESQKIYSENISICVADSKLDHIEANFNQINGQRVPLEAFPNPEYESKFGEWKIEGILKNKKRIEIPYSKCTFEFNGAPPSAGNMKEDGYVIGRIKVSYIDPFYEKSFDVLADITYTKPVLTKVNIVSLPAKMKYKVGDSFDITGLAYEKYYSDGTWENSNDYGNIIYSDDCFATAGSKNIELSFMNEIKCSIYIMVYDDYVKNIRLHKNDSQELCFKRGETYNFSDFFDVIGDYEFSESKSLNLSDIDFSIEDPSEDLLKNSVGTVIATYKNNSSINTAYTVMIVPNIINVTIADSYEDKIYYKHFGESNDIVIQNLKKDFIKYNIKLYDIDGNENELTNIPYSYIFENEIPVSEFKIQDNKVTNLTLKAKQEPEYPHKIKSDITIFNIREMRSDLFEIEIEYENSFYDDAIDLYMINILYECLFVKKSSNTNRYSYIIKYQGIESNPVEYCNGNSSDASTCSDYMPLSNF